LLFLQHSIEINEFWVIPAKKCQNYIFNNKSRNIIAEHLRITYLTFSSRVKSLVEEPIALPTPKDIKLIQSTISVIPTTLSKSLLRQSPANFSAMASMAPFLLERSRKQFLARHHNHKRNHHFLMYDKEVAIAALFASYFRILLSSNEVFQSLAG
jgi:hypothetical protein